MDQKPPQEPFECFRSGLRPRFAGVIARQMLMIRSRLYEVLSAPKTMERTPFPDRIRHLLHCMHAHGRVAMGRA